jgi:alpha-tubulin suppressor-like RCC1 family protein
MKKHFYILLIFGWVLTADALAQSKTIGGGYSDGAAICARGLIFRWSGSSAPAKMPLPKDPAKPTEDLTFSQLNAGSGNHIVALSCYKTVYAYGRNEAGQSGQPTSCHPKGGDWENDFKPILKGETSPGYNLLGEPNPNPTGNPNDPNYPYLGGVKYVTASDAASFAILNTGELVGWGGPAGTWIATCSHTPVYISYDPSVKGGVRMTNVIHVTAGDVTAYITVDETGNGLGTAYYIGNYAGGNSYRAKPILKEGANATTPAGSLNNIKMAAAADVGGFAVDVDGMVWSWGHGLYECATGYNADHNYARLVPSGAYKKISGEDYLTDVKDIVGGNGYGLCVTKEGYVVSWGPSGTYFHGCNGPQFLLYCDGGGTLATTTARDTVKNAVTVARGDMFGFMINDKNEYFAIGSSGPGALGIPGVTSTACFRKMTFACDPIDPCPEVTMPQEVYKCPGETMNLFSGFVTTVGKENRYYFSWYYEGVRLNTSTKQEARDAFLAGVAPPADKYNNTRINIIEPGQYRVEADYIGDNIPCDDCPTVSASVLVRHKEMKVDTLVYEVCLANPEKPAASEEICYQFTSKYTNVPSDFALYTAQTGGQLIKSFTFPATGNKTEKICVTGDKVGVEKKSDDDITYTIWLEDKTLDRGTLLGAPSPCSIGSGGEHFGYEDVTLVTAYKPIILESVSVYVDYGAAGTIRPVIYANSGANMRPNKTVVIKRGNPVAVTAVGELVLPIDFSWDGNSRGISYWIGYEVTGAPGIRKTIGCPLPKWDEKDGATLRAVAHGTGANNATDLTNRVFYNFKFRTLSSYDCGRMKLTARSFCPCPEITPQGPVCSSDGAFTLTKTPVNLKGVWESSNPAVATINNAGGVVIPNELSADTYVTFKFTAATSGCADEVKVLIRANCLNPNCPADPYSPVPSDNICFELNATPVDEHSTFTVYGSPAGTDSIMNFSLGFGTRRGFCVAGNQINAAQGITQDGGDVKYSVWAQENKRIKLPDTYIPRTVYDTITSPQGTIMTGNTTTDGGTCTVTPSGANPGQGVLYSSGTTLAGMYITTTDSVHLNSLTVRANGTNNGNASNIRLRAVIYAVAQDNTTIGSVICRGEYTPEQNINLTPATFILNFSPACGYLSANKTYFISYEYSNTNRAGAFGYCYSGTASAPTVAGLSVKSAQPNVFNNIKYNVVTIKPRTVIDTIPGEYKYEPVNSRIQLSFYCESSCVQPEPPVINIPAITLCAGDTPVPSDITACVESTGKELVWYSSAGVVIPTPSISNVNTGTAPLVTSYFVSQKVDVCISEKREIKITVNPKPVLNSSLTPTTCSGSVFNYTAGSATAGTSFTWERAAVANITEGASSGTNATINETLTSAVTTPVTVTYTFTMTANGCINTQSITVTVNPKPAVTNAPLIETTCSGVARSGLILSSNVAGATYTWTSTATSGITGNTTGSSGNLPGETLFNSGTVPGTVTYRITPSANGCAGTPADYVVTVNPAPDATISYASPVFCNSTATAQPVTVTGTVGGDFSSSPAGLDISLNGDILPSGSQLKTYTVTYTIQPSGGCALKEATTVVTITDQPSAVISYTHSPYCSSLTIAQEINFTGTPGGTFSADSEDLDLNPQTGAVIPVSSTAGTYTVTYHIPALGGCQAVSETTSVTIAELPTATISYTADLFCVSNTSGQPAILNGTGAYTGGTYSAAPVGLNLSNGEIKPNLSTPGDYTVTYTITGTGGCLDVTATTNVTIAALPVADITSQGGITELTCGSPTIMLTATGGDTYLWSNGKVSPVIVVDEPGTYEVTVTAADGCSNTASIGITADDSMPTVNITSENGITELTCTITSIKLTATGDGSFSWANGLGNNPDLTVTSAGTYIVTVTNDKECTASKSFTVTEEKTPPTIVITSETTVLTCDKPSISLTATGGASYSWSTVNGNIVGSSNISAISVDAAGTYVVEVTADNGCTDTKPITISEDKQITAVIQTPVTDELTCTTTSISLTATGGVSYSWSTVDGNIVGATNIATISVDSAGTYLVQVTAANKCTDKKSIKITENRSLPTIHVNNAEICLDSEAVLTASGADTYTWTPSTGLSATAGASVTASPEVTTTYTVEGKVALTGCKSTAKAIVYVETPIGLTLDAPPSVELGNEITITITPERTDHGDFEWFINNQPYKTISEKTLTLQPDAGRQHFLVHTATAKLNCPSSSEIYVEVTEFVPNIIHPYSPSGINCCFMRGYGVEIYNRYMQKVFEGADGWDGTYRGALADPGTYFYRLFKKSGEVQKGTLEVVKF